MTEQDRAGGAGEGARSVEPDARLEITSQPGWLAPLRAFITALGARAGLDEVAQFQLALAIDEATANVINHGYDRRPDGRIWISVWCEVEPRAALRFVLEDSGRQVDPCAIRSRHLDDVRPGGLGVHIIKEVMDECRWEQRAAGGMRLTLVKFVPPQAPSHAEHGSRSRHAEPLAGPPE